MIDLKFSFIFIIFIIGSIVSSCIKNDDDELFLNYACLTFLNDLNKMNQNDEEYQITEFDVILSCGMATGNIEYK